MRQAWPGLAKGGDSVALSTVQTSKTDLAPNIQKTINKSDPSMHMKVGEQVTDKILNWGKLEG